MAASIGGKSLGDVSSESSTKSSNLFNSPIPFSDSDASLIMDLMGTSRTITVTGKKTGTLAQLRTFINDIEGLQNGAQSSLTFVSSWTNANKNVLIQEFTHDKKEGDENKVEYTLVLLEGTAL
ncbi:MAG: hypothetical protein ACTSPI_01230 [Candidatus Heimdallarchaeaceae archaeon]